jgi:hypothetical protein
MREEFYFITIGVLGSLALVFFILYIIKCFKHKEKRPQLKNNYENPQPAGEYDLYHEYDDETYELD